MKTASMNDNERALAMDGPLHVDLVKWWEEFLSKPRTIDDLFAGPLHPLQRRREMEAMMMLAASRSPKTIFEIGADKGGSVWAWIQLCSTARFIIVSEARGTPYADLLHQKFTTRDFYFMESSRESESVRSVSHWLYADNTLIDILFLDGEKGRFVSDFDTYLPLMNPNGIVFFHDITDPIPRDDYQQVARRGYRHEEIIDHSEWEMMKNKEPRNAYEGWLKHWEGQSCGVGCIFLSGE